MVLVRRIVHLTGSCHKPDSEPRIGLADSSRRHLVAAVAVAREMCQIDKTVILGVYQTVVVVERRDGWGDTRLDTAADTGHYRAYSPVGLCLVARRVGERLAADKPFPELGVLEHIAAADRGMSGKKHRARLLREDSCDTGRMGCFLAAAPCRDAVEDRYLAGVLAERTVSCTELEMPAGPPASRLFGQTPSLFYRAHQIEGRERRWILRVAAMLRSCRRAAGCFQQCLPWKHV